VSEGAELAVGTLDSHPIAQPSCDETLPGPATLQTLASGRDPGNELMTAGYRQNEKEK
jgi:hypothetical protein